MEGKKNAMVVEMGEIPTTWPMLVESEPGLSPSSTTLNVEIKASIGWRDGRCIWTIARQMGAKLVPSDLAVRTFRRFLRNIAEGTSTSRDEVLRPYRPERKPHPIDNAFFTSFHRSKISPKKDVGPRFSRPGHLHLGKRRCIWGKEGVQLQVSV